MRTSEVEATFNKRILKFCVVIDVRKQTFLSNSFEEMSYNMAAERNLYVPFDWMAITNK